MLVASTGVIGVALPIEKIRRGLPAGVRARSAPITAPLAARAIMTTDPFPKEAAAQIASIGGRDVTIGGMAKGSGMIEPMMATMLGFVTTDAAVPPPLLDRALREAVDDTFNAITVDGECSTNDCVMLLANGASGVDGRRGDLRGVRRRADRPSAASWRSASSAAAKARPSSSPSPSPAPRPRPRRDRRPRRSPTRCSSRRRSTAAIPNWGRLIAVAGRAGVAFELSRAAVTIGSIVLFKDGRPHDEAAPEAAEYLKGTDLTVGGRPRRRARIVDGVDLRSERRVRAHQRGLPNMSHNADLALARRTSCRSSTSTPADLERCLQLAAQVKADRALGRQAPTANALNGRHVAMLFDKPSLRTRTTFEIAVRELGGHVVALQPDVALGRREPVADVARNLERWVDAVVIRTFSQDVLQEFAAADAAAARHQRAHRRASIRARRSPTS